MENRKDIIVTPFSLLFTTILLALMIILVFVSVKSIQINWQIKNNAEKVIDTQEEFEKDNYNE